MKILFLPQKVLKLLRVLENSLYIAKKKMKQEEDSPRIVVAHESTERDYQLEEKYSIRSFFIGMVMFIVVFSLFCGILFLAWWFFDALPY